MTVGDPAALRADAAMLLRRYSVEVVGRTMQVVETCIDALPPETEVYVAFPPSASHDRLVRIAHGLARAGFTAVPHIVARSLAGFTRLAELLKELHGGGIDRALVIGGDRDGSAGPYRSAEDLLRTGAFEKCGFRAVGLACYPEPHRRIDSATLSASLRAKVDLAAAAGMTPWLVSQFCLEAAPIVMMAERLRANEIGAPLRIGIAGPVNRRALWKYALACGIGTSIRALGTHADAVRDLLVRETPDALLGDLAAEVAARPELGIAGVHIFGFGGVAATAAWARQASGLHA